jgi:hypothetical protein
MKQSSKIMKEVQLRLRLFRRVLYRAWKAIVLGRAKSIIQSIDYEAGQTALLSTPAIFLSSFETPLDFWVLSYLFQEKELTFLSPRKLPAEKTLKRLQMVNHVLYLDEKVDFRFLRGLLAALRDFNRSIVVSPQAAEKYMSKIPVDPVVVVRIAMMANVPIIPVVTRWREGKCRVWVGSRIFISPRAKEFRDIFLKRKGSRKYRDLPAEDLMTIGRRIFSKLQTGETS